MGASAVVEGDVLQLQAHVEEATLHLHVAMVQGASHGERPEQPRRLSGKRRPRPAAKEQEVSLLGMQFDCQFGFFTLRQLFLVCFQFVLKAVDSFEIDFESFILWCTSSNP